MANVEFDSIPVQVIEFDSVPIKESTTNTQSSNEKAKIPSETSWLNALRPIPALAAANMVESAAGISDIFGATNVASSLRSDADIVRKQVQQDYPVDDTSWKGAVRNAGSNLFSMAPAVAVGALTGGSTVPLSIMGAQAGTQKMSDLTSAGVSYGKALPLSIASGGIEAITEKIPFGKFLTLIKGNKGIAVDFAKMIISDQLGEQAATLADQIIDQVKPSTTWSWDDYKKDIISTAKSSLIASTAMGGAGATVNAAMRRRNRNKMQVEDTNNPTVEEFVKKVGEQDTYNKLQDSALEEKTSDELIPGEDAANDTYAKQTEEIYKESEEVKSNVPEPEVQTETAVESVEKPSVQKLNEAEIAKLKEDGYFTDEELTSLQKEPPEYQRERYNQYMGITPKIEEASPEVVQRAQALAKRVRATGSAAQARRLQNIELLKREGFSDSAIAEMSDDVIRRKAKKLGAVDASINGKNIIAIEEIGKKAQELDAEREAALNGTPEEFEAYMKKLDELNGSIDLLGVDELSDPLQRTKLKEELTDIERERNAEQKQLLVEAIESKRDTKVKGVKSRRVRKEEIIEEEYVRGEEAVDWEKKLADEGMPAELDFNAQESVPPKLTRRALSEKKWQEITTLVDNILLGKAKITDLVEAHNSLVKASHYMPRTREAAIEWNRKMAALEEHVAPIITKRRAAFTRKHIAAAVGRKEITKEQGAYANAVFNTLRNQPTFNVTFADLKGMDGSYSFALNLIQLKNIKALAHEIGHYAYYNVLTKEDRAAFRQDFIKNMYDKNGNLKALKILLDTTDETNAIQNPAEYFACKFSDYMHEKVLSPTELNLFQTIRNWYTKLKDALLRAGGGSKFEDVEKLFDKIVDKGTRRFWTEGEARPAFEEPTPGFEYNAMEADKFGLRSLSNRVSYLADIFKKSRKAETNNVLAEIQGPDWGSPEAVKARQIKTMQDTLTFKQAAYQTLGPYLASPLEFVKGTINEKHVYATNLAEMFISHMYDSHANKIFEAEKGLSDTQKIKVTKYLRDIMDKKPTEALTPEEIESATKIRSWLDGMKDRIKASLLRDYKKSLNSSEYNALIGIISGTDLDTIVKQYPKINAKVVGSIAKKYKEIDNWGIADYLPNVMTGKYKMLVNEATKDGKPYKKLIAIGLNEPDAIRKGILWLEQNPEYSGDIFIDTDFKMIMDDKTKITQKQYGAMLGSLSKKLQEDIAGIEKGIANEMAKKTLKRKFKIIPTESFSPYLLEKQDMLMGEENIFPVLRSYAHSIEKKMQLDPVIDGIKRDLKNMTPKERDYILDYIEDVKGRYGMGDKIVDNLLMAVASTGLVRRLGIEISPYRSYSRTVSNIRTAEANIKLGYRPVAAIINAASGQAHTWVKVGAPIYAKAQVFLRTPEGRKFVKDIEPFLGVSVMDVGEAVTSKTPIYSPLGLFQKPEPFNREVSAAASYLAAKERGLTDAAATTEALRSTWAWQFTYNMANLPKIMRNPTGKLLLQFKPYLLKELEFMSNLSGKEWMRYVGMQLALGGPRGAILIAKSLPVLALMGWWQDAIDEAEEWMNKKIPLASRGIAGAPGLINPSLAVDVTAPATFQFPTGAMDLAGPFVSDLNKLGKNVLGPTTTYGVYAEDAIKSGNVLAGFKYWKRLWDLYYSEDNWLRDENGYKLYEVKDTVPMILQSIAGVENITLSRIQNEERILARRDERMHGISTRIVNNAMQDLIKGRPISKDTLDMMIKYGVNVNTLIRRIENSELPPDLRNVLKTEVRRRPEVIDMFPTEADY
jgi:hypothetical protein